MCRFCLGSILLTRAVFLSFFVSIFPKFPYKKYRNFGKILKKILKTLLVKIDPYPRKKGDEQVGVAGEGANMSMGYFGRKKIGRPSQCHGGTCSSRESCDYKRVCYRVQSNIRLVASIYIYDETGKGCKTNQSGRK